MKLITLIFVFVVGCVSDPVEVECEFERIHPQPPIPIGVASDEATTPLVEAVVDAWGETVLVQGVAPRVMFHMVESQELPIVVVTSRLDDEFESMDVAVRRAEIEEDLEMLIAHAIDIVGRNLVGVANPEGLIEEECIDGALGVPQIECSPGETLGCSDLCARTCSEGIWGDCLPLPTNPGVEVRDGLDNDCDGEIDE